MMRKLLVSIAVPLITIAVSLFSAASDAFTAYQIYNEFHEWFLIAWIFFKENYFEIMMPIFSILILLQMCLIYRQKVKIKQLQDEKEVLISNRIEVLFEEWKGLILDDYQIEVMRTVLRKKHSGKKLTKEEKKLNHNFEIGSAKKRQIEDELRTLAQDPIGQQAIDKIMKINIKNNELSSYLWKIDIIQENVSSIYGV